MVGLGFDAKTAVKHGGYAIALLGCFMACFMLVNIISRAFGKQEDGKFKDAALDVGQVLANLNPLATILSDVLLMPKHAYDDARHKPGFCCG